MQTAPRGRLLALTAAAYFIGGCDGTVSSDPERRLGAAIYGNDDRREIFELGLTEQALSQSEVVIVQPVNATDNGDGTATLHAGCFKGLDASCTTSAAPLCAAEPFYGQPVIQSCSGYVVGPRHIATAYHCGGEHFVSGFAELSPNNPTMIVPMGDVYNVIGTVAADEGKDFRIFEVDRPIYHRMAPLRHHGAIADGQAVSSVGHPVGLPAKYVSGGIAKDQGDPNVFVTNLDLYHVNSGSPIFNTSTFDVEGFCSTGPVDFTLVGSCYMSIRSDENTFLEGAGRATNYAATVPGTSGTYYADVTGDTKADAIAVNYDGVYVAPTGGTPSKWSGPFFGVIATYVGDVTGDPDHKADLVAMNRDGVYVAVSSGTSFSAPQLWLSSGDIGSRGTFLADVDGDGKSDLIVVGDFGIQVHKSTGTAFSAATSWLGTGFFGARGTFFVDVTGDGKADAVALGDTQITVRRSTGTAFSATAEEWGGGAAFYGTRGTYFADVTGDQKADVIAVNDDAIYVRRSTGTSFFINVEQWTTAPFFGERGTLFADIHSGDGGKADAIAVLDTGIVAAASSGATFLGVSSIISGPFYGNVGRNFADQ